jgi:hypothetical protein
MTFTDYVIFQKFEHIERTPDHQPTVVTPRVTGA